MMIAQRKIQPDPKKVLANALINAGKALGLSRDDLGKIVGRDRTSLLRGIDPSSKPGELALMLIRCYRSLYAMVGGNDANMQHWMHTYNRHFNAVPAELIRQVSGLALVITYLDAIRGKV